MKGVRNSIGALLKASQPVAEMTQPHSITKRTPTSKPHLSKKRITLSIFIYKVFTSYRIWDMLNKPRYPKTDKAMTETIEKDEGEKPKMPTFFV